MPTHTRTHTHNNASNEAINETKNQTHATWIQCAASDPVPVTVPVAVVDPMLQGSGRACFYSYEQRAAQLANQSTSQPASYSVSTGARAAATAYVFVSDSDSDSESASDNKRDRLPAMHIASQRPAHKIDHGAWG